jgi:hypothetical protein
LADLRGGAGLFGPWDVGPLKFIQNLTHFRPGHLARKNQPPGEATSSLRAGVLSPKHARISGTGHWLRISRSLIYSLVGSTC